MAKDYITVERLRELLNYDPETGIFTWRIPRRKCTVGARAGHTLKRGYCTIKLDYQIYYMHRLAWLYMTGSWPDEEVDHKDRNKSNNVWTNLRAVTHQQNLQNVGIKKSNNSGVTGVAWSKTHKYWLARIKIGAKSKTLGYFKTFEEAVAARKSAEEKHLTHGPVF